MKRSYLDYAMSVIVSRALPDARDGLKPVHRRILYAMHESGHTPDKKYVKSARIVGDVMGQVSPARRPVDLRRAWCAWRRISRMRLLLVDGQGNFGSVDGDPPAAMRYTESPPRQGGHAAARGYRQGHGRFHARTTTSRSTSRRFCRRVFRTCWSTAPAASPSAWRPTSRRTISAK